MSVRRRVWRVGENIDTDALAPGHAMKLGIDGIKPFCLEGVRPDFAAGVRAKATCWWLGPTLALAPRASKPPRCWLHWACTR